MKFQILKSFKIVILGLGLSFFLSNNTQAQGCSDAGFCTLDSFKPDALDLKDIKKNLLKLGYSFGKADYSISVYGTYLEYNRLIGEKLSINTKITSLSQSGNDISVFGLSDLFLNASYKINQNSNFTFGTKLPLSNGNRIQDNLSLPMDYQSSLGTVDLILGFGYRLKNFQFVAAIQQPVVQNSNKFLSENYPANSPLRNIQSTNNFKRSGDILLRMSYPISIGNKIRITPSFLPIYHLSNDRFTDASGMEKSIEGSEGLTLNGNAFIDYEINESNAIQINAGMPFVVRQSRPDGLTRSFVMNFEYKYIF